VKHDPIHRPPLWEAVVERLRASILSGELAAGARLNEVELAQRFGTSRGPVREATKELAREGLVVELPRRGHVVSTLTSHDLVEVYAVREALEVGALKAIAQRATAVQLDGLGEHLDAMEGAMVESDWLAAADHDLAFHRALVALAGNGRMSATYEQMLAQTLLLLRTAGSANARLRSDMPPAIHRELHAALLAGDVGAAVEALDRHYRHAEDRLFAGLDPAPSSAAG
jgi:DNA-binding GntR family transcriptional regulator